MHEDENTTGAAVEFSSKYTQNNPGKVCVLGARRNAGVDFIERMPIERLLQTVWPMKEKDLSPKVHLFVDGMQIRE